MQASPIQFNSKLPDVKTTIFTIMSRLSYEHNAINLSQGFPDFPADPLLTQLATKAMHGSFNQYAPMPGLLELREAIAKKIEKMHAISYNPDTEVTVTVGATEAIFTAIATFISPGDEVLVLKPAYDCYEPAIALQGGIPVLIQLAAPSFQVNWETVKEKITAKTKMIIINTPHNPTGTILSKSDMGILENLLKDTNIILISDEVYEHIIFDGEVHQSACRFPKLAERTFICASFGKTFHNTGWKTGYCVAPEKLMHEFRKTHQFNVFSTHHPVQKAFADYLKDEDHYISLPNFYEHKRNTFRALIQNSKFKILPCKGTYFQLLDYSEITKEGATEFAIRLVKEHGIASIPVSVFNTNERDDHLLRFCFAKETQTLEKAAAILNKL
ncbi:methionine aminotransferase [Ascidiimonas sp. W6]|uniref:methionine aminotransferase n=1 Tax=Ascidiimonas meishanensis TaxID=3128903 RepID=UPI0030EE6570